MGKRREPLMFEAPWTSEAPRMVNPEVGFASLVVRGPSRSFTTDVTLLDSTDHRLLRAGIVLAHRVIDSMGEWYLDAPTWAPLLPVDCSIALDAAGDLPRDFTCLVKPFLRGATLNPAAALSCDRHEAGLLRSDGSPLADIRDDKISVVESGVTTSRAREVTVTPHTDLTDSQREWLVSRMVALGATQVIEHPSTLERLGPQAGAMSDVPREVPPNVAATLEGFLGNRLTQCLRRIIEADLTARGQGMHLHSGRARHPVGHTREPGVLPDSRLPDELLDLGADPVASAGQGIHDENHGRIDELLAAVGELRVVIDALSPLLEPRWVAAFTARMAQVSALDPVRITIHLMPESYYQFLDMLVVASRAPKIVGDGNVPARPVLGRLMVESVRDLLSRCDDLHPDDEHGWARARHSAEQASSLTLTLRTKGSMGKLSARLLKVADALGRTGSVSPGPTPEQVSQMGPQEAFDAGRRLERELDAQQAARERFLHKWPDRRARILKTARTVRDDWTGGPPKARKNEAKRSTAVKGERR